MQKNSHMKKNAENMQNFSHMQNFAHFMQKFAGSGGRNDVFVNCRSWIINRAGEPLGKGHKRNGKKAVGYGSLHNRGSISSGIHSYYG